MRVLTVSALSSFLLMTCTIGDGKPFSSSTQPDLEQSEQVSMTSRGRSTTYRGSGRREILALPLPAGLPHLS